MTENAPDILINEIMDLIPHRIPMLLIDKLTDVKLGESATGIKNVTMNEWFFQGHFPGHPVMPGVLIVEAMAQAAGVLVTKSMGENSADKLVYFMSIEEAKFRKPVVPGDTLKLKVSLLKSRGNIWKFRGEAWVGDVMTDEAIFTAMIASK
jgi:3-hydroxyacyl-[acyl-carrier-protein] dehydratase